MTDPTDGFDRNDELTEALRRDLRSSFVPFDDERAEEMISQATQAQLVDARRWNAPLAAAAAVLLVGGGTAIVAANVGNGHHTGTPAADGAGPYASTCSTYGPLPSDAPAASATPAPLPPSATSTTSGGPVMPSSAPPSDTPSPSSALSTSAVPSASLPSESPSADGRTVARVRIGATPTVVFPVVVSPGNAVLTETASPVPQDPPSTPDPSASDPCVGVIGTALPSAIASKVVVPVPDTPTGAQSTTAAGVTPSGSASSSYEPPVLPPRPAPTKAGETNAVPEVVAITADPGTSAHLDAPVIAADRKFLVTAIVLRNTGPASTGTLTVSRAGASVLSKKLQELDGAGFTVSYESLVFTSDAPETVSLSCTGTTACDASVTLLGDYVAR